MIFLKHEKKGVYVRLLECSIPELKCKGYILKHIKTDEIIVLSIDKITKHFSELSSLELNAIKT